MNDEPLAAQVLSRLLSILPRVDPPSPSQILAPPPAHYDDWTKEEIQDVAHPGMPDFVSQWGSTSAGAEPVTDDQEEVGEMDGGEAVRAGQAQDKAGALRLDEDVFGSLCVRLILAQRSSWVTQLLDSRACADDHFADLRELIRIGTDSLRGITLAQDMLGPLNDAASGVDELLHSKILDSAHTVKDVDGLWTLAAALAEVGNISQRIDLLRTCVTQLPGPVVEEFVQTLGTRSSPERRFEEAIWLGAMAGGAVAQSPEASPPISAESLAARAVAHLNQFAEDKLGWYRVRVWGREVNAPMAHCWGLAILTRCCEPLDVSGIRAAVENDCYAALYQQLRQGNWSNGGFRAGLLAVLETLGGEALLDATAKLFAELAEQWSHNAADTE